MPPSSTPIPQSLTDKNVGSQLAIDEATTKAAHPKKGLLFWLTFLAMCVSLFMSALEVTGTSTALPTIVEALNGDDFVWVGSAYPLAATAFLPASGGVAEIFGRRAAMLSALGLFALGSALCGSARNMSWLIAARISRSGPRCWRAPPVSNILIADLVPLQERGIYSSLFGLTWALAAAIGPLVGGALAENGQWRWFFYLNLPISGACAILVVACLRLKTPEGNLRDKLVRMDWIGNMIFIAASTSTAIALTWGGITFPWSSARSLVPLVVGLCGLGFFLFYEARFRTYPIVPFSLISNRTSLSGYLQTFIVPIVVIAVTYYLPTYYQACKGASPIPAITNLPEPLRSEVRQAFGESIAVIWQTMLGIAGLGLLTAIPMKAFPLHTQVDERWGIEEKRNRDIVLDSAGEPEAAVSLEK